MRKIFLVLGVWLSIFSLFSQENYRSPLDIPTVLSANFGELRPNHFHSGIDFKTQGVINKPVYSIADGYISRISVSPSGYGLALYITHSSTGHESVYAHLEKFIPKLSDYVKSKQYEFESYRIDLKLDSSQFPVSKGELIAYSGNTGSSGGPHVHFEIRDINTQSAIDVIPFYKDEIKDSKAPQVRGIAVYPLDGFGVVNGSSDVYRQSVRKSKSGDYMSLPKIKAWGKIAFGIYSNDYMDNTNNIYGVRSLKLYCDDSLLFSSIIDTISFETSKMINSMTDYHHWCKTKEFYVKSFIDPGNKLNYFTVDNGGWITIEEERAYRLRYELEDAHGNVTFYSFEVQGKMQDIPEQKKCSLHMPWNKNNYYINTDINLIVPAFALYEDLCFAFSKKGSVDYFSDSFIINDKYVPLNSKATLKIKIKADSLIDKSKYGVIAIDGKRPVWLGGKYQDGFQVVKIDRLGNTYAIGSDLNAPKITPLLPEKWLASKKIRIKATDDLSGIASYRGAMNGKFVLFEHDVKSPIYTCNFDPSHLEKGKNVLEFTVIDGAGNKSTYKYEFNY